MCSASAIPLIARSARSANRTGDRSTSSSITDADDSRPIAVTTRPLHRSPQLCQAKAMAGVGDALEWARQRIDARVPRPISTSATRTSRSQLPGTWLLASLYFRADVRRLDHVAPEGPVLLVGGHSGATYRPTRTSSRSVCSYFGVETPFYQRAHDLVTLYPPLRSFASSAPWPQPENAAGIRFRRRRFGAPGGEYEVSVHRGVGTSSTR